MHKHSFSSTDQCEVDMTPMIDVVFQLIIFFVVTLKMTQKKNEKIFLEDGKHGELLTQKNTAKALEIEIAKGGRLSIHNAVMNKQFLSIMLKNRVNRMGPDFPLLIRADRRTPHEKVKEVMDICTGAGIWKLSFVAIQDHKAGKKK